MTDITQQYIGVMMQRPNLDGLSADVLPPELSFRWHQPGDDRHWLAIHHLANLHSDVVDEMYEKAFGTDPKPLAKRQCYLLDGDGQPIGTATAWYDGHYNDASWGWVHYVAIVPAWQGRGVGKALMSIILHRLIELGHDKAYLFTQTCRVPAINLYLALGFVPVFRDEQDEQVWRELAPALKYPIAP